VTEYLVDLDTGCWVWQRAKTKAGYGQMYVDGKMRSTSLNGYGQVWHEGRLQRAIENARRALRSQHEN
jgi:hypothetical protein